MRTTPFKIASKAFFKLSAGIFFRFLIFLGMSLNRLALRTASELFLNFSVFGPMKDRAQVRPSL